MNLKWMIDGVSNYNPLLPFVSQHLDGTRRMYIREDSAQHKVCPSSLLKEYRIQTHAIVGLIKQLADVGTALS